MKDYNFLLQKKKDLEWSLSFYSNGIRYNTDQWVKTQKELIKVNEVIDIIKNK